MPGATTLAATKVTPQNAQTSVDLACAFLLGSPLLPSIERSTYCNYRKPLISIAFPPIACYWLCSTRYANVHGNKRERIYKTHPEIFTFLFLYFLVVKLAQLFETVAYFARKSTTYYNC